MVGRRSLNVYFRSQPQGLSVIRPVDLTWFVLCGEGHVACRMRAHRHVHHRHSPPSAVVYDQRV